MTDQNSDIDFVESLASILKEHNLGEIELTRRRGKLDEIRIRVSAPNQARGAGVQAEPAAPAPPPAAAGAESPVPEDARTTVPELASHPGAVTAPMVGTVFLQPEPGAAPFIEVGQNVMPGDTLFIIEAMKTMNHIPAPHAGTVRRILVENSSIVEFGSPMAIID